MAVGVFAAERRDDIVLAAGARCPSGGREPELLEGRAVAYGGLTDGDQPLEQEPLVGVCRAEQARRGGFPADRRGAFC